MKLEKRIIENNKQQNIQLESRLVNDTCCSQEMILEEVQEKESNKICLKYTCLKCKKAIFDLQERPKKTVTLTIKQREKLFFYLGSIQQILYEAENNK